ncbi:MAG: hypothetical protein V4647_07680 [Pseudomonadota bacterium]
MLLEAGAKRLPDHWLSVTHRRSDKQLESTNGKPEQQPGRRKQQEQQQGGKSGQYDNKSGTQRQPGEADRDDNRNR